jgi:Tol biopolymer transport system component
VATGEIRRLTFDPEVDHAPVWSPNGRDVAFDSHRSGLGDPHVKSTNGSGSERRLYGFSETTTVDDWSKDGGYVALTSWGGSANTDIWILPLSSARKPFACLRTKFREFQARFSPDSRWIAYVSNESGRNEVYVLPFDHVPAAGGSKWLISSAGGSQPAWRADGRELFYIAPDNKIMVAAVRVGPVFRAREAKVLFEVPAFSRRGPRNDYAISPDGRRFLVRTAWRRRSPVPLEVLLNWVATLKDARSPPIIQRVTEGDSR